MFLVMLRQGGPGWSLQGQHSRRGQGRLQRPSRFPVSASGSYPTLGGVGECGTTRADVLSSCLARGTNRRAPRWGCLFSSIRQEPPDTPVSIPDTRAPGGVAALLALQQQQEARRSERSLCPVPSGFWDSSEGFLAEIIMYALSQPPINLGALILSRELVCWVYDTSLTFKSVTQWLFLKSSLFTSRGDGCSPVSG